MSPSVDRQVFTYVVLQDRAVRLWHLTSGTCVLVTSMSPHAVLTVVSAGNGGCHPCGWQWWPGAAVYKPLKDGLAVGCSV
jgi:hypothetical protein